MSNAERLTRALGGWWYGHYGLAFCPAHRNTKSPALSIFENASGHLRLKCHTGCDYRDVIDALRASHLNGAERMRLHSVGHHRGNDDRKTPKANARQDRYILKLWDEAVSIEGTLAEDYLYHRGILGPLPSTLKFASSCWHGPTKANYPAMIAGVGSGKIVAVHRTFLARDSGSKAMVDPNRMMLGPCGGQAVRLRDTSGPLMIGEGIETCLSAMQGNDFACWAALSANGLARLSLFGASRKVILLRDNDVAGADAVAICARRLSSQGHDVWIAGSPIGNDINDLLRAVGGNPIQKEWVLEHYAIPSDPAIFGASNGITAFDMGA